MKIKYTFVHELKNYCILHSFITQVVLQDKKRWEAEEQTLHQDLHPRAGGACPSTVC